MRLLFFVALITTIGCQQPASPPSAANQLDWDSLLNSQVGLLTGGDFALKKGVSIDGPSISQGVAASVNWGKELGPFRSIAFINKPVYRNGYSITTSPDPKSNLTIKSWEATQDAPIRSIKVFYLHDQGQIKKVEATIEERNFVFTSRLQLQMEFSSLEDPWRLERYKVVGSQKFIMGDPTDFSLEGVVVQR
jgi:hypothetical protein